MRADRHRWLTTNDQARRFMLSQNDNGRLKLATLINEAGGSRPARLVAWALMHAGLPVSGVLSDRTIAFFEARHEPDATIVNGSGKSACN